MSHTLAAPLLLDGEHNGAGDGDLMGGLTEVEEPPEGPAPQPVARAAAAERAMSRVEAIQSGRAVSFRRRRSRGSSRNGAKMKADAPEMGTVSVKTTVT